jgi:hypothetical protein
MEVRLQSDQNQGNQGNVKCHTLQQHEFQAQAAGYALGRVAFTEISSISPERDPELPFGCAAKSNSCVFSPVNGTF